MRNRFYRSFQKTNEKYLKTKKNLLENDSVIKKHKYVFLWDVFNVKTVSKS